MKNLKIYGFSNKSNVNINEYLKSDNKQLYIKEKIDQFHVYYNIDYENVFTKENEFEEIMNLCIKNENLIEIWLINDIKKQKKSCEISMHIINDYKTKLNKIITISPSKLTK